MSPDEFDLLLIPGGGAPENLRIDDAGRRLDEAFTESGKPVGAICHGAATPDLGRGARGPDLTAVNKIRDDIRNAGGNYVDEPLVIDGNLITSRVPGDLPQFNEALVGVLESSRSAGDFPLAPSTGWSVTHG